MARIYKRQDMNNIMMKRWHVVELRRDWVEGHVSKNLDILNQWGLVLPINVTYIWKLVGETIWNDIPFGGIFMNMRNRPPWLFHPLLYI